MTSVARLLRGHESLDWDSTFTVGRHQVSAVEIKVVGRYGDAHGLTRSAVADLFATMLKRRKLWSVVSIAGRTAYCAALLEGARKKWKLSVAPLDRYIDALWQFTSSEDLGACEEALARLRVEEPARLAGVVPSRLVPVMFALLDAAWDAATTELGAEIEVDSPATRIAVTFSEWMARRAYVPAPPITKFARSSFDELDGWGDRHPREHYV